MNKFQVRRPKLLIRVISLVDLTVAATIEILDLTWLALYGTVALKSSKNDTRKHFSLAFYSFWCGLLHCLRNFKGGKCREISFNYVISFHGNITFG